LEKTQGQTAKGFFYLGISYYKQGDYQNSILAFEKAEGMGLENDA